MITIVIRSDARMRTITLTGDTKVFFFCEQSQRALIMGCIVFYIK